VLRTSGDLCHDSPNVHIGLWNRFVVAQVVGVRVPKLAIAVSAPAAHVALVKQNAGMPATRGDLSWRSAAEVDKSSGGGKFVVTNMFGVFVSQLAEETTTPTSDTTSGRDPAAMEIADVEVDQVGDDHITDAGGGLVVTYWVCAGMTVRSLQVGSPTTRELRIE
jgi:hypothetical protein